MKQIKLNSKNRIRSISQSKKLRYCFCAYALTNSFSVLSQPLSTAPEINKPSIEIKKTEEEHNQLAKQALMLRLSQSAEFSAVFSQQVLDEENNILQQSQGKLAVKKPDLVYWQTLLPEESLIVSDGSSLWFYDPFIEQATAYDVKTSIANTPILLLTSTDDTLWQQYRINQQSEDIYIIHSLDINSRVKALTLNFAENSNRLASFSILDSTGQLSVVTLSSFDAVTAIDDNLFKFTLPVGVYLDDQR